MPLSLTRFVAGNALLCLLLSAQSEDQFTPKERISRIRDLGKRKSDAIPALSDYLSDGDRDIRVEAIKAIVKIGGEASLTPLVRATHDTDAEVQIRATDGLTDYYVPGYVAKGMTGPLTRGLRQAKAVFGSRNDQVIDQGVTVREDIAPALGAEVAGGASVDSKTNAARAAGILRAQAAVPSLVGSLRAHDNQLILESLIALQKIKDPAAGPGVAPVTRDLDERVQITALQTVGLLRSTSAAPEVRTALSGARNIKVKRAALSALAYLGLPQDRSVFQQYIHDGDSDQQVAALEGLGRIREPEDFPALQATYNEPNADWEVHLAAAFALVNEGKVDTAEFSPLPFLVETLGMKGRSETAGAYLAELARRDDVQTGLLAETAKANRDQKLALCPVLGESQSTKVIPVLTALSKDIDPDVSLAAGKALKIIQARKPS